MSRPIKVEDGLFASLQTDAQAKGISMQQALSNRLAGLSRQAQAAAQDHERLSQELRTKEDALARMRQSSTSHQSTIQRIEAERVQLRDEVQAAEETQLELSDALDELRMTHEELSRAKAEAERDREKARKQLNLVLNLALIGGCLALGVYLVRRYSSQRKPDEPAVLERVPAVQSWYS